MPPGYVRGYVNYTDKFGITCLLYIILVHSFFAKIIAHPHQNLEVSKKEYCNINCLLNFVAFLGVASLFVIGVENRKSEVDNRKVR